jgi:diguanylate cyclase (GGDEF)-like protein
MKKPDHMQPERRHTGERRRPVGRRLEDQDGALDLRAASWQEQKLQFGTRYAFWVLGMLYFNFIEGGGPIHLSQLQINLVYLVYLLASAVLLLHGARQHHHHGRYRVAMWLDIGIVSISLLNDPYPIPPTLLAYLMIVLGNGMRYGMPLFREGLIACMVTGGVIIASRVVMHSQVITVGLVYFALFCAIILLYTYKLMGRIERHRMELEKHSRYDMLTGLYNRRALIEVSDVMFQRLQRNQYRMVMLFADLDGFKGVNDRWGHSTGDRVLREFADIVRRSIRSVDIAARFGGDEFVLLLDDTRIPAAERIAARIQSQVRQWSERSGTQISVSFGIGEAPTHGRTLATLLEQVDQAMYRSKTSSASGGYAVALPPVQAVKAS